MKKILCIVIMSLSVCMLLQTPKASAGDDYPLNVMPSKVYDGQPIMITFDAPPNSTTPGKLNLTLYYGGREVDSWWLYINSTYSIVKDTEMNWMHGVYFILAEFDDKKYTVEFEYMMLPDTILQEARQSGWELIRDLGNLISLAIGVIYGNSFFMLFILILIGFWTQHRLAHAKDKRSFIDWFLDQCYKARGNRPYSLDHANPEHYQFINARANLMNATGGPPSQWDKNLIRNGMIDFGMAVDYEIGGEESVLDLEKWKDELAKFSKVEEDEIHVMKPTPQRPVPANPSIGESSPKEEKASKPPDGTARKGIPREHYKTYMEKSKEERD